MNLRVLVPLAFLLAASSVLVHGGEPNGIKDCTEPPCGYRGPQECKVLPDDQRSKCEDDYCAGLAKAKKKDPFCDNRKRASSSRTILENMAFGKYFPPSPDDLEGEGDGAVISDPSNTAPPPHPHPPKGGPKVITNLNNKVVIPVPPTTFGDTPLPPEVSHNKPKVEDSQ